MSNKLAILIFLAALSPATRSALAFEVPPGATKHTVSAEDQRAIKTLLATYTHAVSTGDETAFSGMLLNDQIPFFSTDGLARQSASTQSLDTRQYQDFRDAVFRKQRHFTQRFYNVRIEQDAELASVSLDFVTIDTDSKHGSYGWKTLQLVKVNHTWKIASEFYSAYPLNETHASHPKVADGMVHP